MATFCDRFSSYYLSTYQHRFIAWDLDRAPPEDVEGKKVNVEHSAARHAVPERVRDILPTVITPEVHARMIEGNFEDNVEFYQDRGFTVLKSGSTLVLEHERLLPGYLIKTAIQARTFHFGTMTGQKVDQQIAYTNLLRAEGLEHYAAVTPDEMFTYPEEYLYEYQGEVVDSAPLHHRFFAISKKEEVYSPQESLAEVAGLKHQTQLEVAQRVCKFVQQTGLSDMHPGNLLIRRDLDQITFSVIDTEPLGFLIEASDDPASLTNHATRVVGGMIAFRDSYCRANGLMDMAHYVDRRILEYVREHEGELRGKEVNEYKLEVGDWVQDVQKFDWVSGLLIFFTIPFFWIVLPVLAARAAFSAPPQEQLA